MHLHLTLLPLLPLTSAFTLNTKTPYWSYTTTSLANTTSEECKTAYSAEIACNPYLLALVNANEMRPYLPSMQKSNFTDTCTRTCHDSLAQYIQNVESTCSSPEDGDAALKGVGVWGEMEFRSVPVVTVGRVLEYTLMSACAVDEYVLLPSSLCPAYIFGDWLIMKTGMVRTATSRNRQSSQANSAARGAVLWHIGIIDMSTHTASGSLGIHRGVISRWVKTGKRGR